MKLSDLEHFKTNPTITFKKEMVLGREFTTVFYVFMDPELWVQKNALETRGHVFDENGNMVIACFDKFFNINENERTQAHALDFTGARFYEKRDGSMITPMLIGDQLVLKTKKSFFSEVAVQASKDIKENEIALSKELIGLGYTPIFEYTSPKNKVVIDYGDKPEFVLLAARSFSTLEYMPYEQLCDYAAKHHAKVAKLYHMTYAQATEHMKNGKDTEGFVVELNNGTRIKMKTEWYVIRHKICTDTRERDIACMIVEESIDDVKNTIVGCGYELDKVLEIEKRVANDMKTIYQEINDGIKIAQSMSGKEAYVLLKDNFYQKTIFRMQRNSNYDPTSDVKKYWYNKFMPTYSLGVVYNDLF